MKRLHKYGSYGSPYATDSIFNKYGSFGGKYAEYSAYNDYSASPPLVVCDGSISGCVTTNQHACAGQQLFDPASLCSCQ